MAKDPEMVVAEVLLREPRAGRADRVARYLQEQGIETRSVGAASISIRCSRSTFENVFHTTLKPAAAQAPGEGVHDFGAQRRDALEAETAVQVPDPIAGDVEGVYVQPPARYL